MGIILCIGPLLTSDPTTRWRLALPPFKLLAVFLNPAWSGFLAAHVTTPPRLLAGNVVVPHCLCLQLQHWFYSAIGYFLQSRRSCATS